MGIILAIIPLDSILNENSLVFLNSNYCQNYFLYLSAAIGLLHYDCRDCSAIQENVSQPKFNLFTWKPVKLFCFFNCRNFRQVVVVVTSLEKTFSN